MASSRRTESENEGKSRRVIAVIVLGLVGLFIFAVLLFARLFFAQPFNVPSTSNEPNLMLGDYFMVNTLAYRTGDPQRGDMAVFKHPANPSIDYVKRVIGLPGETIQLKNGVPYINGVALVREPAGLSFPLSEAPDATIFRETLSDGRSYLVAEVTDEGAGDNTLEYVVPPGHYFVLGDNRDNSADSRFLDSLGFIPRENFIGRHWFSFFTENPTPLASRPDVTTEP